MLLIVGLGNPGAQYAHHRHNVGFMAVDAIHRRHGFPPWRRRFQAEAAEGVLAGHKVLLLKPQTYMNDSGRAVQAAAAFYKLPVADMVVIHDELDLAPGKTRMKVGGGAAGHNGLRSIDAALGDCYRRLRIGIGHPGSKDAVMHYVLHDFAKADQDWLKPLMETIADNAALLAEGRDSTLANRLHAASRPATAAEKKAKPEKGLSAPAESDRQAPQKKDEAAGRPEGPLAGALKKLFGGK